MPLQNERQGSSGEYAAFLVNSFQMQPDAGSIRIFLVGAFVASIGVGLVVYSILGNQQRLQTLAPPPVSDQTVAMHCAQRPCAVLHAYELDDAVNYTAHPAVAADQRTPACRCVLQARAGQRDAIHRSRTQLPVTGSQIAAANL
jgi:hypothetical protein